MKLATARTHALVGDNRFSAPACNPTISPRKQPFRQPPHATVLGRGYLGGPARNAAINPPVCNPTINPPVCNPAISPGIRPRREPEGPRRGISS